jgi:small acid-soluble spore protein E (minor gamma-type SASP)
MAKRSKTGTNVDQVRAQNAASQAGNSDVEFASDTDVQAVRKANQKSKNKMK